MVVVSKLSHDRPCVEAPQNDRPFGRPRGEDVPSSVPVSYRMFIGNSNIVSAAQRTKSNSFKKKCNEERKRADERNISYHWQHVVLPLDNRSSMCSSMFGSSGFANRLFILVFVFSLIKVRNSRHFCAGVFDTQTTTNSTQNDAERTVDESETTRRSTFATATTRVRAKRVQQLPEERRRSFLVFGRKRDDE